MTDKTYQDLINMNYRVLTLLGMMTAVLMDVKSSQPASEHYKFDWILQALNDVVYFNKPIPPLPENHLL